MRKYLVDTPKSGDTVVFYYAGHGSLRLNHKGTKLRVLVDGNMVPVDSTIVPSDAWTGGFDVRDREMTRIFDDALDKGIKLTVLLDSCHSGAFTRGVTLGPRPVERVLPYDPRALDEGPDLLPDGKPRPAPAEHPKNPALIFSAAQQDQTAKESAPSSSSPESHGAFTVALIHAMESLPMDAPASVVYEQVLAEMQGTVDQTPSLDAGMTRRNEPLFGGESSKEGKLRAAAVGVDGNGQIVLDSGKLAGVGPGSTFVRIDSQGRKVILKVKDLDGIARSRAAVLSPPGAQVDTGQVFELDKWAPPPLDPLSC